MNKAFVLWLWENFPSTNTALNEYHLNLINRALNEIDDRVIRLDANKLNAIEASELLSGVAYDDTTGILTFTKKNGSSLVIDLPTEKIALNIYYDPITEKLILPLVDGTQWEVDLSRLITEYEFVDSDTIAFSIGTDGKVTAIVKEGSIEEKHLRRDYLTDIKVEAALADTARQAAEAAAETSVASKEAAAKSEANAKASEDAAEAAKDIAVEKAGIAVNSAASATAAKEAAAESAVAARASEVNSKASEQAAKASETNSAASEQNAADSALLSESWAVGGTGIRDGEDTDNSKFYCRNAKGYRDEAVQSAESATDALEQINKKLQMAEFDIDDDGNLIYTDGSSYVFTVNDNGDLDWEVAA